MVSLLRSGIKGGAAMFIVRLVRRLRVSRLLNVRKQTLSSWGEFRDLLGQEFGIVTVQPGVTRDEKGRWTFFNTYRTVTKSGRTAELITDRYFWGEVGDIRARQVAEQTRQKAVEAAEKIALQVQGWVRGPLKVRYIPPSDPALRELLRPALMLTNPKMERLHVHAL